MDAKTWISSLNGSRHHCCLAVGQQQTVRELCFNQENPIPNCFSGLVNALLPIPLKFSIADVDQADFDAEYRNRNSSDPNNYSYCSQLNTLSCAVSSIVVVDSLKG